MQKHHSKVGLIGSLVLHGAVFGTIWAAVSSPVVQKVANEQLTSISMEMLAARLEQPQVAVAPEISQDEPASEEQTPSPEPEKKPEPKPAKAEPEKVALPKIAEKPKKEKPKEKPKEKEKEKPKPVEKPKEKAKEKPKDKPKEQVKPTEKPKEKKEPVKEKSKEKAKAEKAAKPIKALETGAVAKQGIVAKVIPNAAQSTRIREGGANGSEQSNSAVGSKSGALNGSVRGKANGNGSGNSQGNGSNNVASAALAPAASSGERDAYLKGLQIALQRKASSTYPAREKMMRKMGVVKISFTVSPSGQITGVKVVSSSGSEGLDAAAVKVAQSLKYSPPPAGVSSLSVPIRYVIQ